VLVQPASEPLFLEFADSALKFELRAWTDRFDRWLAIKSDLNVAVYGALQAADMEIAIPQREVRLRPT
jgi:small-conductance mechanosensitive channel